MDVGPAFREGGAFLGVERVNGVVAAFGVEVRADGADDVGGAEGFVAGDVIDGAEGAEDAGAVVFGIDGPGGAFETADGGVGVDGDGEDVAEVAGAREVVDVAGVEDVEAAIGEDETTAVAAEAVGLAGEIFEREKGGHWVEERGG